jgi:hypothetical protein
MKTTVGRGRASALSQVRPFLFLLSNAFLTNSKYARSGGNPVTLLICLDFSSDIFGYVHFNMFTFYFLSPLRCTKKFNNKILKKVQGGGDYDDENIQIQAGINERANRDDRMALDMCSWL